MGKVQEHGVVSEQMLYLVRHAQSVFNAEGRMQGHADPPLSSLGEAQTACLLQYFQEMPVHRVYSSPLMRATQTAGPLAASLGLKPELWPDLVELNVGVFSGLTLQEQKEKHPDLWYQWRHAGPGFALPGGESRLVLRKRARRVWHALLRSSLTSHEERVVVVSHGGFLGALLSVALDLPARRMAPFTFFNAAVTQLRFGRDAVRLLRMNDTSHLLSLL